MSEEALQVSSHVEPEPRCEKSKFMKLILFVCSFVSLAVCLIGAALVMKQRTPISEFLFLNDPHIDPLYDPYSDVSNDPVGYCRRPYNGTTRPNKFGQYLCDPPEVTFLSALRSMKTASPNPEFVIFAGDSIAHGLNVTHELVQSIFKSVITSIEQQYPGVPILVALGNNDFVPNYGTPETDHLNYANIAEVMKSHMNELQHETFLHGGYYYHDIPNQKLRLLLLNSVIYNPYRPVEDDPSGQFAWIRAVCEEAKGLGYDVGVAMHIFPGVTHWRMTQGGWHDVYTQKFASLVSEFGFKFILVAHCHYDMLLPLCDSNGTVAYALSSAAISPGHESNPAFRVLKYQNGEIGDIDQWYADLLPNPSELHWKRLYRFTDEYGVPDVSQDSLSKAVKLVSKTSEGIWRYREKVTAMAMDHGSFYYCLLKVSSIDGVKKCMKDLVVGSVLAPWTHTEEL